MALLTISITDQTMDKKSAEVAFAAYAVATAMKEFQRGNGTVTSGTILGVSGAGVANTALGSWSYTASATKP
jgi:uncharacterized membrane protein YeaQ/YmgE (transglycosylase-associated protein family)